MIQFLILCFVLLGIAADAYTTTILHDRGFKEQNPIARWIIRKGGIEAFWGASMAVAVVCIFAMGWLGHDQAVRAALFFIGLMQWVPAILNWRKIRA